MLTPSEAMHDHDDWGVVRKASLSRSGGEVKSASAVASESEKNTCVKNGINVQSAAVDQSEELSAKYVSVRGDSETMKRTFRI